jgi:hypothetical protein
MRIKYTSLHHIDHLNDKVQEVEIKNQGEQLSTYIERLLEEIIESSSKRSFDFQSDTTEVRSSISKMLAENYAEASSINASRLLQIEKDAQERIRHLNAEIQQGSLFHAYVEDENDARFIIISKADHNEYLDELDFELRRGLPWKKRVFKAILVTFEEEQVNSVYVYDTNSKLSTYWWNAFLELKERYTDIHNTKTSLHTIDRKIFSQIKEKYPADHVILRNSAIGYFRNKDEFDLSEFINQTFRNYYPVDNTLPLEKIIGQTEKLPERWGFDRRFAIKKDEINKRAVNKIKLSNNIDLLIKDHIENLNGTITAEEDQEGNKYVKIKSEEGYKAFKR